MFVLQEARRAAGAYPLLSRATWEPRQTHGVKIEWLVDHQIEDLGLIHREVQYNYTEIFLGPSKAHVLQAIEGALGRTNPPVLDLNRRSSSCPVSFMAGIPYYLHREPEDGDEVHLYVLRDLMQLSDRDEWLAEVTVKARR